MAPSSISVTRRLPGVWLAASLLLALVASGPLRAEPFSPATRTWGEESLSRIDQDFWLPERNLYALKFSPGGVVKPGRQPAMMWDCGVQLSALVAAARLDPSRYRYRMDAYIRGLEPYWTQANGIGGYDVQPGPKPNDRYYDDNVWLVLALADAYGITNDPRQLERARAAFRFVLSGEDNQLGGGIYWHEPKRESKNTCSNAPAIVAAARLYQLTHQQEYLDTARRLYDWTRAHLQAPEGLLWDNIKLDGQVNRGELTYNTGLMIRAASLLHAVTKEQGYLDEAHRIARAAEARWMGDLNANGATAGTISSVGDSGRFTHLLLEGFLALYDEDHDPHWLKQEAHTLTFLHDRLRDASGRYPDRWRIPPGSAATPDPARSFQLLDQASVARAYWVGAAYLK